MFYLCLARDNNVKQLRLLTKCSRQYEYLAKNHVFPVMDIFPATNFHFFLVMHIFKAIYFHRLQNCTQQEQRCLLRLCKFYFLAKIVKIKLICSSSYRLETSTCIEWSITRSAGHTGLIFSGSPPNRLTASLMAAKSTTAGTPLEEK